MHLALFASKIDGREREREREILLRIIFIDPILFNSVMQIYFFLRDKTYIYY